MAEEENMSPEDSPATPGKNGVRRVNNMPLFIGGAVLLAFVFVMAIVAGNRAGEAQQQPEADSKVVSNSTNYAETLAGQEETGFVPALPTNLFRDDGGEVPAKGETKKAPAPTPTTASNNPPPLPDGSYGARKEAEEREADRLRQVKMQMFEDAVKSGTTISVSAPRSSGSPRNGNRSTPNTREEMLAKIAETQNRLNQVTSGDPTAAYQAKLAAIENRMTQSGAGAGSSAGGLSLASAQQGQGGAYDQFAGKPDRWELGNNVEVPRTPYELKAGSVIPGVLISGINSDLPGQIMAQVSQNVYDTAVGRHLLIPQGSKLVGTYDSQIAYGQEGVLVAWQRITFPDGKTLDIGGMPGADAAGYSGFRDQVNHHFVRVFGSAFLMSGVVAGVNLSQEDDSEGNSQRAGDALSEALGQELGRVSAEIISKNLNIAPTIEIRPGYRLNIIATKDLTFTKPYQAFDY